MAPTSSKEFLNIQANSRAPECGFTVKLVRDMKTTYSEVSYTFVSNAPFLYPLKTLRFSDVFRGVEKECIGREQMS